MCHGLRRGESRALRRMVEAGLSAEPRRKESNRAWFRRPGLFVLFEGAMNEELLEILDRAAATPPFERLLSAPSGRRVFHAAPPGHAFVAAALARALDSPVLLVAADPRAAGELAA